MRASSSSGNLSTDKDNESSQPSLVPPSVCKHVYNVFHSSDIIMDPFVPSLMCDVVKGSKGLLTNTPQWPTYLEAKEIRYWRDMALRISQKLIEVATMSGEEGRGRQAKC
ncbi:unnamed protein product [Protopolystoma xenopodis]|uniref:Uncharacterized protein n=1 Tax=Protopolystoma xenopodis TaxID=117903 RepID=A0A3S4ZEF2_9PLAT|nr:unnamed protein product [Protopolystoma xenopodis]